MEMGLPIRESLFSASREESRRYFAFENENKKIILVFGGSLGAKTLNEKIFEIVPELVKKYDVIHITGKGNKKDIGISPACYKQLEFLKDEMKYVYGASDLAICRAGASSLFELAAARIPMILLPLGLHVSRGDQIINAKIFANKGWAQWVDESAFQKDFALKMIESTMESLPEKKKALETAPSKNAAGKVSQVLWDIMLKYEGHAVS